MSAVALQQDIKEVVMMEKMNFKRFALGVTLVTVAGSASAALSTEVTTAITGAGTDATAAVGLMIVVAVSIWALRRVARLFGG